MPLKRVWSALLCSALGACSPQILHLDQVRPTPQVLPGHIATADGLSLPYRAWHASQTPSAVIVALHGFNDYSKFFDAPGTHFASQGITSYAYDQRGFGAGPFRGRWFDTERYVEDARAFVDAITDRHPDTPIFLLGNSMGGAVALSLLAEKKDNLSGAILVAPAVWGRETMPAYQTATLWLAAHTVPGLRLTGRGLKIKPSDNIEMLRALGRDPLVIKGTRVDAIYGLVALMDRALDSVENVTLPTLILYGAKDQIIRAEPTKAMVARFKNSNGDTPTFAFYDDGYHMLLRGLDAMTVWNDIEAWIENPKATLPSGATDRADAYFFAHELKKSAD